MTADEIAAALTLVREETDLNSKSLLLAGLVSELFCERENSWQASSQAAFPSIGTKPIAWPPARNTIACQNSMQ